MALPVLIVTPQAEFGASLRQELNSLRFDLFTTSDFTEAVRYIRKNDCLAVILDALHGGAELSVLDIGFALRQVKSDLRFVVISGGTSEVDTHLLSPLAVLSKPLSMIELNLLLEKLVDPLHQSNSIPEGVALAPSTSPETNSVETSWPVWLKDVSKAAQHLTRLTLESSAQAALITRQNELWAYAGQLSREAAQEITESLQHYWDAQGESDLLRFVRLRSTDAQHMLYARKLAENMLLALVFDAETPFSTIRSQANRLVKNLADNSPVAAPSAIAPVESPVPVLNPGNDDFDNDDGDDLPPISDLLGEVPPPNPPDPAPRINLPWEMLGQVENPQRMAVDEPPTTPPIKLSSNIQSPVENQISIESSPSMRRPPVVPPVPGLDETVVARANRSHLEELAETRVTKLPDDLQLTRKQEVERDPESFIETRPYVIAESMTEVAHRILLESPSPALVNLSYACLLIPRFDNHHLVGDVVIRLNDLVPQLCVAFAWRLEFLSVRPDYLQWIVRVPPNTAPGYVIRVIRQQTSARLFGEFPRFKADNPSDDFWAPGYLIMGSSEAHPHQMVRDHIKRTRGMQGLGPRG